MKKFILILVALVALSTISVSAQRVKRTRFQTESAPTFTLRDGTICGAPTKAVELSKIADSLGAVIYRDREHYAKLCYNKAVSDSKKSVEGIYQYLCDSIKAARKLEYYIKDSTYKASIASYIESHSSMGKPSKYNISGIRYYIITNSVGGNNMHFHYTNSSTKTIKYLTINVLGYKNAVGDYVKDEIGRGNGRGILTLKETGPVSSGNGGGGEWETVIYNWSAETPIIKSITIQYMDGTSVILSASDLKAIMDYDEFTHQIVLDAEYEYNSIRPNTNIIANVGSEVTSIMEARKTKPKSMDEYRKEYNELNAQLLVDYNNAKSEYENFISVYSNYVNGVF